MDVTQKSHRKMLIDTFVNAIFLYDDKVVITFNFREGSKTITFSDLQQAIENGVNGSDMNSVTPPSRTLDFQGFFLFALTKNDMYDRLEGLFLARRRPKGENPFLNRLYIKRLRRFSETPRSFWRKG